jgi:hypothetical protein
MYSPLTVAAGFDLANGAFKWNWNTKYKASVSLSKAAKRTLLIGTEGDCVVLLSVAPPNATVGATYSGTSSAETIWGHVAAPDGTIYGHDHGVLYGWKREGDPAWSKPAPNDYISRKSYGGTPALSARGEVMYVVLNPDNLFIDDAKVVAYNVSLLGSRPDRQLARSQRNLQVVK